MASTTDVEMTPERFAALVEAFGGDIGRWPVPLQASARARVASDTRSGQKIAEAQTFDRLLGLAPATAASPELLEQIMASAARQSQLKTLTERSASVADSNIIPLPLGKSRLSPAADAPSVAPLRASSGWEFGRHQAAGAGGMLAASLLIGIWLGASGVSTPSFGTAFQERQTVNDLDAMREIVQSALSLELLEGTDEEAL